MESDLALLEQKLATLIAHTRALRAANESLRRDLAAATERNREMNIKVQQAGARLDALIARDACVREMSRESRMTTQEQQRRRADGRARCPLARPRLQGRVQGSRARRAHGRGRLPRSADARDSRRRQDGGHRPHRGHGGAQHRQRASARAQGARRTAARATLTMPRRGVESSRCTPRSIRRWRVRKSCSDVATVRSSMFPGVFESAIHSLNQCSRSEVAKPLASRCAPPCGSA